MTEIKNALHNPSERNSPRAACSAPGGELDYEHFAVGDYIHFARRFSARDFAAFAELSGDRNPLHYDAEYARRSGFARPIVPLQLAAAPLSAIAGMLLPGRRALVLGSELRAVKPVEYEQSIEYSAKIISKHDAQRALVLRIIAFHGANVLLEGELRVRVRADAGAESYDDSFQADRGNVFQQRVTLITGATGAIGRAVARTLARRGWKLILQGRNRERVAALVLECGRDGAEAFPLVGGLTSADERCKLIERLCELPAATALVHAASPRIDAALHELIEVNYAALRELTEALAPGMLQRQHGRVLFIGTAAVDHPQPGWEDYAAAKQAAAGYVRAFDQRYAAYGLFGSVLSPGYVLGEFSEGRRPDDAECLLPEEVAEAIADELESPDRRQGAYLRLEPGCQRRGEFGFYEASAKHLRQVERALLEEPASAVPQALSWTSLDDAVRRFFRLPGDASLAEAGLGVTPGWDSLGHLELLLHLESTLDLSFTSGELNRTTRYADLQRLVDAKRRAV